MTCSGTEHIHKKEKEMLTTNENHILLNRCFYKIMISILVGQTDKRKPIFGSKERKKKLKKID